MGMFWSLPAAMALHPPFGQALGAERTVSDVVPDAVGLPSALLACKASGLQVFQRCSALVSIRWSLFFLLFSHLPRSTWSRWLKVLFDAVEPGGLLVFTTHGVKAADFDHVQLDDEGYFFAPSSESTAIDGQEYGTTFTTEAFVLARIAETVGADTLVHKSAVHF